MTLLYLYFFSNFLSSYLYIFQYGGHGREQSYLLCSNTARDFKRMGKVGNGAKSEITLCKYHFHPQGHKEILC